jgi:hypothetical protein
VDDGDQGRVTLRSSSSRSHFTATAFDRPLAESHIGAAIESGHPVQTLFVASAHDDDTVVADLTSGHDLAAQESNRLRLGQRRPRSSPRSAGAIPDHACRRHLRRRRLVHAGPPFDMTFDERNDRRPGQHPRAGGHNDQEEQEEGEPAPLLPIFWHASVEDVSRVDSARRAGRLASRYFFATVRTETAFSHLNQDSIGSRSSGDAAARFHRGSDQAPDVYPPAFRSCAIRSRSAAFSARR